MSKHPTIEQLKRAGFEVDEKLGLVFGYRTSTRPSASLYAERPLGTNTSR